MRLAIDLEVFLLQGTNSFNKSFKSSTLILMNVFYDAGSKGFKSSSIHVIFYKNKSPDDSFIFALSCIP